MSFCNAQPKGCKPKHEFHRQICNIDLSISNQIFLEKVTFFPQGDSGGPLVCTCNGQEVLAGVILFGEACGTKPGLYLSVADWYDWIDAFVALD